MCRVLKVHFSGFYAWLKEPLSQRAFEDARQTELIQQAWTDSGKVYGYRKLADDLRPSRQIALQSPAGQWMQSRMTTDLALQALLSAVWRRKPKHRVMIHSPSRDIAARYPVGQWIKGHSSLAKSGNRFSANTIWMPALSGSCCA
jgi:hypothetical protein